LAIPLKTALNLKIASSVANVFDQAGNQVMSGDQHGMQSTTSGDLGLLTYTLHKSGH
jgi:hypothetical protein